MLSLFLTLALQATPTMQTVNIVFSGCPADWPTIATATIAPQQPALIMVHPASRAPQLLIALTQQAEAIEMSLVDLQASVVDQRGARSLSVSLHPSGRTPVYQVSEQCRIDAWVGAE